MYSSKSLSLYGFVGFMFKGGTLQEDEIIVGDTGPATAGGCKDHMGAPHAHEPKVICSAKEHPSTSG